MLSSYWSSSNLHRNPLIGNHHPPPPTAHRGQPIPGHPTPPQYPSQHYITPTTLPDLSIWFLGLCIGFPTSSPSFPIAAVFCPPWNSLFRPLLTQFDPGLSSTTSPGSFLTTPSPSKGTGVLPPSIRIAAGRRPPSRHHSEPFPLRFQASTGAQGALDAPPPLCPHRRRSPSPEQASQHRASTLTRGIGGRTAG
jgi:hypothetical protein